MKLADPSKPIPLPDLHSQPPPHQDTASTSATTETLSSDVSIPTSSSDGVDSDNRLELPTLSHTHSPQSLVKSDEEKLTTTNKHSIGSILSGGEVKDAIGDGAQPPLESPQPPPVSAVSQHQSAPPSMGVVNTNTTQQYSPEAGHSAPAIITTNSSSVGQQQSYNTPSHPPHLHANTESNFSMTNNTPQHEQQHAQFQPPHQVYHPPFDQSQQQQPPSGNPAAFQPFPPATPTPYTNYNPAQFGNSYSGSAFPQQSTSQQSYLPPTSTNTQQPSPGYNTTNNQQPTAQPGSSGSYPPPNTFPPTGPSPTNNAFQPPKTRWDTLSCPYSIGQCPLYCCHVRGMQELEEGSTDWTRPYGPPASGFGEPCACCINT